MRDQTGTYRGGSTTGRWRPGMMILLAVVILMTAGTGVRAAQPDSGTLTPTSGPITWQGTATGGGAIGDPLVGVVGPEDLCEEGLSCDTFMLTLAGPQSDWTDAGKMVHVHLEWELTTQDYDLYIHKCDLNGRLVDSSGNGLTTYEDADITPGRSTIGTGTFAVHVVYYTAVEGDQYIATAEVVDAPPPVNPPPPTPVAEPVGSPRFYNYIAPPGVADDAGEPSLGVNGKSQKIFDGTPNGGTVNYFGGFLPYMLRVTFDDSSWPATATWEQAPLFMATLPRVFGDPILFTDRETGRTFVSQEMGLTPAGSTMEWTDDDGRTFTPSEGSGAPSGIDHQTVGGGPYHEPIPEGANPLYPHGVWYCSQSIVDAVCSLSLDGGITFGPAIPMYSLADCDGLHGHIKIGPDGTAYVPNRNCNGEQAVVVSEDNGLTWDIRHVPGSLGGDRDPSVAIGSDSTLYFAYQNGDGRSHVAVSLDKGLTWVSDTDVGAQLGIRHSVFHAAVAGDGDRAAVAFFGSTSTDPDYDTDLFDGVWYLYVSTTYDRGQTWWTQNVTPGDPIQRGGICDSGTCRNLLDFIGAEIDNQGRILVGYDDGCITRQCVTGERSFGLPGGANDFTAKAVIARQTGGRTMFAEWDPPEGPTAEPPQSPPLPPAPGSNCDGTVAEDGVGDAINPAQGYAGDVDQLDITGLRFALTPDGQSLVTTITVKDFSTQPAEGNLGQFYRVIWSAPTLNGCGKLDGYATEARTDAQGGITYKYGKFDDAGGSFTDSVTASGSYMPGPGGEVSVVVPLSYLGNPTIPVTTQDGIPAVIEPYAVVHGHEQAVYWTAPADRAPDAGSAGSSWAVCVEPAEECFGDGDARIAYSPGWHEVAGENASDGTFRLHVGSSPMHSASLTFEVAEGETGTLTYHYGTSTKGGSAEVLLDGEPMTVSYAGSEGGLKSPVLGASLQFTGLAPGVHTLELTSMQGAVYVDGFCLETASMSGQPASSGPGVTSSGDSSLLAGQQSSLPVAIGTDATAISAVAASSAGVPLRLMVFDPSGSVLQTMDSQGGVASITVPVSASGTYLVTVVNLSLGSAQVWTAVTPTNLR